MAQRYRRSSGDAAAEDTPPASAPDGQAPPPAPVLWVDAGNGAAGDMLLAALLDAGADLDGVRAGLSTLPVEPIELELEPVRRHGLRASALTVRVADAPAQRHLADLEAIVGGAPLPEPVRDFALATFRRLADAEGRVHGIDPEQVHFHEVGALDAIADVVGCALALHQLHLLDAPVRVVSPIALGSGTVRAAHGVIPVPGPAVLELLTGAGAPIRAHQAEFELCTPTGAALLATLATSWGAVPDCVPRAVGVGAGRADPAGHANVLRVLVGQPRTAPVDWLEGTLYQLETTVDDLDPRIWPDLLDQLRGAGAADAWCAPVLMRKGRPGQVLTVLAEADRVDLLCRMIFEQTTTLGVRVGQVRRRSLRRDQIEVPVGGGVVHVKRGFLGDRLVTSQPEYDDLLAQARRAGVPVASLLAELDRALGDG
ncbi:nickel pincer cofactor biosynthesis protein LarC [Rugosimonospora acidiphila]|uniref:Pyridinium-3,5-bisthiocarboxylic acid mononucleotide nickel insertion protein n=1 Tax=Rugosimonospora acidiphila TaxID=556531 RepID=A0ABP9RLY0_9ACTN